MKKWLFFLIFGNFLLSYSYAGVRNPKPGTPDQTLQNDQDLQNRIKTTQGTELIKTLAQLKVTTPKKKGIQYFCSDCVNALVCISTGTVIYGFASMQATNRTTVCN